MSPDAQTDYNTFATHKHLAIVDIRAAIYERIGAIDESTSGKSTQHNMITLTLVSLCINKEVDAIAL